MTKKPIRTHALDRDGDGQLGGSLPGNKTAPMATDQTPLEAIADAEPELVAQVIHDHDDGPDAGMHDTEIGDEDDTPTVCEICNIAFTEDDDCLTDVTFGPVHAACCGPERESYVNLATGEPLKEDEPLPTPYKYSDLPAARAPLATIDGHGDTFTPDQIAAGQTPVADQDGEVETAAADTATTIADDDPLVTIETSTAPVAVRLRELTLLVNARRLYKSPEGYSSNYGAPYIADATADAWVKAGLAEAVPSAGHSGGIKLTHEARRALTELKHGVA